MAHHLVPAVRASTWFLPLACFAPGVAHSEVRVDRKTCVVKLATGNQQTDYVAISTTVTSALLLLVGSVSLLISVITNTGVIGLLSLMRLAGAALGTQLKQVSTS